MRVPWRDQPWDARLCASPLGNSSCLLLANIGENREDAYETDHAGKTLDEVDHDRIACLSERGTFMSPTGYRVLKHHPYSSNRALKGHLFETPVTVPGYAFEAVPFRWLSRETFEEKIWDEGVAYEPEREQQVLRALDAHRPLRWVMDGANQQAILDRFFESVEPSHGLVFVYLKHSPLQEGEITRRLLLGAARITSVTPPPMWKQSGDQPFDSSMWETIVGHSLRADQRDGCLLPYHDLVRLQDEGRDVSGGLAWAPEDRDLEFSYVTEHVSDDTAIAALNSLRAATDGFRDLGLTVLQTGVDWLDAQIERLWQLRGPTPGLGSALAYLGVPAAHRVAREIIEVTADGVDPWSTARDALTPSSPRGRQMVDRIPSSAAATWRAMDSDHQHAMMILSAMDVTRDQLAAVLDGDTTVALSPAELIDNPYFATICTYGAAQHIAFGTVDRACFPASHVTWPNVIATIVDVSDAGDRRRCEAMLVEALERLAEQGDTIAGEQDVVDVAKALPMEQPVSLTTHLLRGHGLDAASIAETAEWTPLGSSAFADGAGAYKLARLAEVRDTLLYVLEPRRDGRRFRPAFDARAEIDIALAKADQDPTLDEEEDLARREKAAGLTELYSSRLSVLVGPAGTGKTTLLKALVGLDDVARAGVHLLAPTGKARVQMQQKVGLPAHTLASFLIRKDGFDPQTGRYRSVEQDQRVDAGVVIIDEASMLTEEMLAATLSAFSRIERLVLVGDYRQLPPIGAGRPFVDLVEWMRPESFGDDGIRVAPGYVELTVFRRQKESGSTERDDLRLAQWFGDGDLPGAADEIWEKLRTSTADSTVSCRPWDEAGVLATLMTALQDELGFVDAPDPERAFKLSYGAQESADGKYVNWNRGDGGAGESCERWQILSPTRSRIYGTTELNRHLKRKFRQGDLDWATRGRGYRPPKPIGPEQIVMGDKVMQTRNESFRKAWPKGSGMDYVANGEIGVVVGRADRYPKAANVEFSSQVGASYSYWPSSGDDPPLELAWAVTVHKAQGSEFGTTFLVLPESVRVSRELIYTALTRQTEKVVILREGGIDHLKELAAPSESEAARRLTDLFGSPQPRTIMARGALTRFDGNLIHVAAGGVMVRSKNEVILAQIFEDLVPGQWRYELPLRGSDGVIKYPDFTIDLPSGECVIWEHLGMMNNPRYAAAWELKKGWYRQQGYRPSDEEGVAGDLGLLVWTDDTGGVDHPAWLDLARQVIGLAVRPSPRRAAKKAPGARAQRKV